jgi:hypothetical protein
MQTTPGERLVHDYLRQLERAMRDLPRGSRRELRADIEAHLDDTLRSDPSEAQVRDALDRLGTPEEIVEAERERLGMRPAKAGWRETATVILLLIGGLLLPLVGWVVGVVLLWGSRAWTVRDKLIGTFVVPGGYAGTALALTLGVSSSSGSSSCPTPLDGARAVCRQQASGGSSTVTTILLVALAIALLVAPLASGLYLLRRARPAPDAGHGAVPSAI